MNKRIWIICMIALASAVFLAPSMAGAEATVIWDGEVELPSGTFDFVPTNNHSASYSTYNFTDLGALMLVNESQGISYNISDAYFSSFGSFSINALNGTNNEPWGTGNSSSWYLYINDVYASRGLGGNPVSNGDKISFWYAPTNTTTYMNDIANATWVMNVTLKAPMVDWEGEIELPSGTANFTPTNNHSASYEINNFTDLGAFMFVNESQGIGYNISDTYFSSFGSFSMNAFNGTINEPYVGGISRGWSLFINGVPAPMGLGGNSVSNGDKITFWYCPTDATSYVPLTGEATRVMNITLKAPVVYWEGEIELPSGTANFTPTNNHSASYEINNFTDLGAFMFVNESQGISYNISDTYFSSFGSFSMNAFNGTSNEPYVGGISRGWSLFINGVPAPMGLGGNSVSNGDKITFWYCPTDATSYAPLTGEATRVMNISVAIETVSSGSSGSSGGGTGHATIAKLVDEEEPVTTEEPQAVEDTPAVEEETTSEPQKFEPVTESNVETEKAQNDTPGFEGIFAVSGLLLSAMFIMKRSL
ncbi:Hypothetical protein Mbur_1548 [Methanococcoides burtonii DSM 6242]|uniref:DUF4430 domain-containing protein n=2 Tax=Methanococcoides burtonii TaxID=29291 RepID=Q12VS2_METBU|nr:Hypothetical protein Mbur_1548 [Methanococcoides burtonii DSM 6242]